MERETLTNSVHPILAAFAEPDVVGVICFGSVALGADDSSSDIDLFVVCDPVIPNTAERQSRWAGVPNLTDLHVSKTMQGWKNQWAPEIDLFELNGKRFDVVFNIKQWVETVIDKVKKTGATEIPEMNFRAHTFLGLIENSIILYDPYSYVAKLKGWIYPYSPLLKQHLIDDQLALLVDAVDDLGNYASRNIGNGSFLFQLTRACDAMVSVLYAINEQYDPATKRPEVMLRKLHILPASFVDRYDAILLGPFTLQGKKNAAAEMLALQHEIEHLARRTRLS